MTPKISLTLLRTQSDERLLKLSSLGHEAAFEAIVERYRKALHRYCRRILTENRAEDAVQQTFLRAWQSLQQGTEVTNARAWLYRIAHNEAVTAVSKHGYDYDELVETIKGGDGPQEDAERRAVMRETFMSLAALPDRQRDALLQIAFDGRSHAEVAKSYGMTEGAVRQLIFRARSTVRSAATAVVPMPLIVWLADAGTRGDALPARITELAAVGGSAGTAGVLAKTCAVAVTVGAIASAPVAIHRANPDQAQAKSAAADIRQLPGTNDMLSSLGIALDGAWTSDDEGGFGRLQDRDDRRGASGDSDGSDEDKGRGGDSEDANERDDRERDDKSGSNDRSSDDASDDSSGSNSTSDHNDAPQPEELSSPESADADPPSKDDESVSGSTSPSGTNGHESSEDISPDSLIVQ